MLRHEVACLPWLWAPVHLTDWHVIISTHLPENLFRNRLVISLKFSPQSSPLSIHTRVHGPGFEVSLIYIWHTIIKSYLSIRSFFCANILSLASRRIFHSSIVPLIRVLLLRSQVASTFFEWHSHALCTMSCESLLQEGIFSEYSEASTALVFSGVTIALGGLFGCLYQFLFKK